MQLINGAHEAGGVHFASHARQLVIKITDTGATEQLVEGLFAEDPTVVRIGSHESRLYGSYTTIALVREPMARLHKAFRWWEKEQEAEEEPLLFAQFVDQYALVNTSPSMTGRAVSYLVPQMAYLAEDEHGFDVDMVCDIAQVGVWLPLLQRRYGFGCVMVEKHIAEEPHLSGALRARVRSRYEADFTMFADLGGAAYRLL